MATYFIRRFLLVFPTFIGITLIVFIITRFVPGGPIEQMIQQMQGMSASFGNLGAVQQDVKVSSAPLSEEQLKQLKEYYGFDKPMIVSYFIWLKNLLMFDLGRSTRYGEPVWDIIKSRLPVSIFYGIFTLIITYLVCIPLGLYKAIKHSSWFDNFSSAFVFIGYAIPGYVVGIALILIFAVHWDIFPLGGFTGDDFDELSLSAKVIDILYHAVLPLISYVAGSFAVMTFLMKNSVLDNLAADYVKTAIQKGLSFKEAIFKHAFRNSIIPLATHFGNNISIVLTGSFLIETIFNINGFGLLGYESLLERDYPIVMGILAISTLLFLIGNILSDICVAIVDPRVKFE